MDDSQQDWPARWQADPAGRLRALAVRLATERTVLPSHAQILRAAGIDPDSTVTDAEGYDWGLETDGDLWEASVLRHVPLGRLTADDVNLLLFWGSHAAPLLMIALHHLERDPFAGAYASLGAPMLVNAVETVYAQAPGHNAKAYRARYGARLQAVCARARAMLDDGVRTRAALPAAAASILAEAEAHIERPAQ